MAAVRWRWALSALLCAFHAQAACVRSAVSQELLKEGLHRCQHCAPMVCFKGAAGEGGAGQHGAMDRRMHGGC